MPSVVVHGNLSSDATEDRPSGALDRDTPGARPHTVGEMRCVTGEDRALVCKSFRIPLLCTSR